MLLTEAGLISTPIQAILYGFSVLMFMLTLRLLLRNRRNRHSKYALIATASALLIFATAEMIVNIVRLCQGFLNVGPVLPGGPVQYFNDVAQPTFIIKSCLYNVQTLILDGVVIHRTYVVWQRNILVVVVPILGWLGLLASSIGTNYALSTAASHSGDIFAVQTGRWITSIYSTTLATNLSATSLLAYRIWKTNRISSQYKTVDRLSPVLRVVIESGAIYSMTITAALVTFVCKSPGVYVILDMISPIISIVFNMIIIRVGLASDKAFAQSAQSTQQSTHVGPLQRSGSTAPSFPLRRMRSPDDYEMKPITIEITQCKENDTDKLSLRRSGVDPESESSQGMKLHANVA